MMATLYDVSVPAISQHLKRIYADNELAREATVKQYLMVQTEGEREVQRKVDHYSLQTIIAVGFKIENERAVQFRKWANQIVKDYTIQGWVMDVERLKSGGSVLTEDFFERQLEKIREIRQAWRRQALFALGRIQRPFLGSCGCRYLTAVNAQHARQKPPGRATQGPSSASQPLRSWVRFCVFSSSRCACTRSLAVPKPIGWSGPGAAVTGAGGRSLNVR